MNTVHCTPSCDWVQFVAPFSLLPKPQKTVFLGVGTEQVRSWSLSKSDRYSSIDMFRSPRFLTTLQRYYFFCPFTSIGSTLRSVALVCVVIFAERFNVKPKLVEFQLDSLFHTCRCPLSCKGCICLRIRPHTSLPFSWQYPVSVQRQAPSGG